MTVRPSAVFALIALPPALILAGCAGGKESFTLKGSVSYQGKPLTVGTIRLFMADNRMAIAIIQPDGYFEATDVFPGEAKVTVEQRLIRRAWKQGRTPKKSTADKSPAGLPAKYKDVDTSGLVFTLKRGEPLNIQLQ